MLKSSKYRHNSCIVIQWRNRHKFCSFLSRCIFRKGFNRPPKVSDANIERSMRTTFLQICNLNTILTRCTTLSSSFLALFYWHNLNRWSNYLILLHHETFRVMLQYFSFFRNIRIKYSWEYVLSSHREKMFGKLIVVNKHIKG